MCTAPNSRQSDDPIVQLPPPVASYSACIAVWSADSVLSVIVTSMVASTAASDAPVASTPSLTVSAMLMPPGGSDIGDPVQLTTQSLPDVATVNPVRAVPVVRKLAGSPLGLSITLASAHVSDAPLKSLSEKPIRATSTAVVDPSDAESKSSTVTAAPSSNAGASGLPHVATSACPPDRARIAFSHVSMAVCVDGVTHTPVARRSRKSMLGMFTMLAGRVPSMPMPLRSAWLWPLRSRCVSARKSPRFVARSKMPVSWLPDVLSGVLRSSLVRLGARGARWPRRIRMPAPLTPVLGRLICVTRPFANVRPVQVLAIAPCVVVTLAVPISKVKFPEVGMRVAGAPVQLYT